MTDAARSSDDVAKGEPPAPTLLARIHAAQLAELANSTPSAVSTDAEREAERVRDEALCLLEEVESERGALARMRSDVEAEQLAAHTLVDDALKDAQNRLDEASASANAIVHDAHVKARLIVAAALSEARRIHEEHECFSWES